MQLRIFFVVSIILISATACGSAPEESAVIADVANAQEPAAATPIPDDVIATVNGEPIFQEDFERALARRQSTLDDIADPEALQTSVLNTLIEQMLIEQAAVQRDIVVSAATIEDEVAQSIELAGGEDAWRMWLQQNLYTEAEFRDTMQDMLITAQMRDEIAGDIESDQPQVHARHILVADEATANEVLSRLQAGEGFADLALEYSRDVTTRQQGGDLGWFAREELLEPVLADIAFGMQPGEIAGPIPTRLGYHVLQTIEFDTLPLPDEKKAQIAQVKFDEWLITLNDSAIIERFQ